MLQKLGPALDQVKAWQQAVIPAIDELRQVGSLFPQLMVQIRDSARQIHEFSQQQQRFEVALLDLHSELQRLKSYLCCAAEMVEYTFSHVFGLLSGVSSWQGDFIACDAWHHVSLGL